MPFQFVLISLYRYLSVIFPIVLQSFHIVNVFAFIHCLYVFVILISFNL